MNTVERRELYDRIPQVGPDTLICASQHSPIEVYIDSSLHAVAERGREKGRAI
jgi:hypothetical protein